jgi:hypothetical protein
MRYAVLDNFCTQFSKICLCIRRVGTHRSAFCFNSPRTVKARHDNCVGSDFARAPRIDCHLKRQFLHRLPCWAGTLSVEELNAPTIRDADSIMRGQYAQNDTAGVRRPCYRGAKLSRETFLLNEPERARNADRNTPIMELLRNPGAIRFGSPSTVRGMKISSAAGRSIKRALQEARQ